MLKAPADFPFPGSEALLGERRVRINRVEPDGRRFVTGKGVARTVDLDQLSDASLPDQPMDRWYAERPIAIGGEITEGQDAATRPTPIEDLYRDFLTFARARGVEEFKTPTRHAFSHFLALKGNAITVNRVDGRNHRCAALMLRPIAEAA